MLTTLGYTLEAWNGKPGPNLVVIGREAWSGGHWKPSALEDFVLGGGRAIVFAQDPEWLRTRIGLRVAPHCSRRVYPVDRSHPVMKGMIDADLRDWTGRSTLIEAYPEGAAGE